MNGRRINWDFKHSDTLRLTHGFHTYPAKMIPQVAEKILYEFGQKAQKVFDPYCGTGTSLVEANLKGINAIGTDLNPLARLIATAKTTPIEVQTLEMHLRDFYDFLYQFRFGIRKKTSVVVPQFANIDYWFGRSVKENLAVVKEYINNVENREIKAFFQVAFSQTIRECSWTRNNEFKLYKMSAEKIKTFRPDVFSTFETILARNRDGLIGYMQEKPTDSKSEVFQFNTIHSIPKRVIKECSIDLVLTSPPYGDSTTTVAYGQFSALANQWLDFMDRGRKLDGDLMGGSPFKRLKKFKSDALNDNIRAVLTIDEKRAFDVIAFYSDYEKSIRNVAKTIKPKGFACYVVSNRTVRGTTMVTDQITRDFFESNGFKHIDTYKRKITSKRMPRRNSSIGKAGKTSPLMNTESIVVMQKN